MKGGKFFKDTLTRNLLIAIITVVFIWFLLPLLIFFVFKLPENAGVFGDTFGAVNALFSALAFAFLIYTALMQKTELELQREELKLTRKELERSAKAQKALVNISRSQIIQDNKERISSIIPILKIIDGQSSNAFPYNYKVIMQPTINPLRITKVEIRPIEDLEDELSVTWTTKEMNIRAVGENIEMYFYLQNLRELSYTTWTIIISVEDADSNLYEYIMNLSYINCELLGLPKLLKKSKKHYEL